MRRAAALLFALLLTGCGPGETDGPFTDSRTPPNLSPRYYAPEGWAWGLVQTKGAPPTRYGVAGPVAIKPRGDVLILVGYGRSAEAWFETATALTAKGYNVWVLDGVGQGGSGRFAHPRDLGHVPDFAHEVAGLRAMGGIIGHPPVLVAETTAVPTALTAVAAGMPARAVLLARPVLDSADAPIGGGAAKAGAAGMVTARLGWLRAVGQRPWKRIDPTPKGPGGVMAAWQQANPDLRMGGVSWGWIAAFDRQARALTPTRLKRVTAPVQVAQAASTVVDARTAALCSALPRCVLASAADPVAAVTTAVDQSFASR